MPQSKRRPKQRKRSRQARRVRRERQDALDSQKPDEQSPLSLWAEVARETWGIDTKTDAASQETSSHSRSE